MAGGCLGMLNTHKNSPNIPMEPANPIVRVCCKAELAEVSPSLDCMVSPCGHILFFIFFSPTFLKSKCFLNLVQRGNGVGQRMPPES